MTEKNVFTFELAGRPLVFEIGELAKQANAAVFVRYGDTVVLSTVVASKEPKDIDFFPLQVGYEERLYAAGKVPGGFIKREGRPSENAILSGRLIDRPIRPLFPDGFRNEVQVINTVMSLDHDNSPAIAALIGSSLALSISNIPFDGPIAGVVVGRVNGEFLINPTVSQLAQSDIDLTVAGTKDAINMVEAGAKQVSEEEMLEAIMFGHDMIKKIIAFQEEIVAKIGQEKVEIKLYEVDAEINASVRELAEAKLIEAIQVVEKQARQEAIDAVNAHVLETFEAQEVEPKVLKQVKEVLSKIVKEEVRRLITDEKVRPDGRGVEEIRPLSSRTDLLPRTHGSALFTRGQTQALTVCTLGALNEHQMLDGLEVEETKRFMHHYNFPAYSVGETGRYGAPGRREIGHGALGERALRQVIPSEETFPYTIRLVSEVLESNGSSSQASICASTMALMAAGVPIEAPVAGIAMGLVAKGDNYTVLSDIQGLEDHLGDMDFKVAGTEKGVTALQMDIKISGLSREILEEALQQAKIGRMHILNHMLGTISEVREDLSTYAPKIHKMHIKVDKIRDVIGPGGKQINEIIEKTGVKIDIEQDGTVYILHDSSENIKAAISLIEDIVREVEVGKIYLGKVVRIEKFGAFIQLFKGQDGLCHISQLAEERVAKTEDVVALGDEVLVKVTEIDERGRVNVSRKEAMREQAAKSE